MLNPRWIAPILFTPTCCSRSSAPSQRSISGLSGFLTRIRASVPARASASSDTANGLAVVRAPIQKVSSPALRAASACCGEAISVATCIPSSSLTRTSQGRPCSPTPSKDPGRVRGFHRLALKKQIPPALKARAVSKVCSSVSALHGPAKT